MLRLTSRAILFNRRLNKILMIKYLDQDSPSSQKYPEGFWATPGGGLDQQENFHIAISREILEETGITDCEVRSCLASRIVSLNLGGGSKFYYERYYLVETATDEIRPKGLGLTEKKHIQEFRWWKVEDLIASKEVVLPVDLKKILDQLKVENPQTVDLTDQNELPNSL